MAAAAAGGGGGSSSSSVEAAAEAALRQGLEAALAAALGGVAALGAAAAASLAAAALRRAQGDDSHDYVFKGARGLYLRLSAQQAAAAAAQQQAEAGARTGVSVSLPESAFAPARAVHYASAAALAAALADALIEMAPSQLVARAHAPEGGGGALHITSHLQLERQRARGRLLCVQCGRFLAGYRGLRWHAQAVHGEEYGAAVVFAEEASSSQLALAPQHNRTAIASEALRAEWAAAAEARAARRAALPQVATAARCGDIDALRRLARAQGWTAAHADEEDAVHWAAGEGQLEALRVLVEEVGADASGSGANGRTPAHWAARNGRVACLRYLLVERGCEADSRTADGTTPLMLAVWRGQRAAADLLLSEGGADLSAVNTYGCNAIQWAAQAGDAGMCAWLRKRGLDVTIVNRNGHSALHKAAQKNARAVCEWLVDKAQLGLKHMRPDAHEGATPGDLARAEGFNDLAAWLDEQRAQLMQHEEAARRRAHSGGVAAPPQQSSADAASAPLHVIVCGLGALGSLLAARLAGARDEGFPVRVAVLARGEAEREARARGVSMNGLCFPMDAIVSEEMIADGTRAFDADVALLAGKRRHVPALAALAAKCVKPEGDILSLANGVSSAADVAREAGAARAALEGITTHGALSEGPAAVRWTGRGKIEVGWSAVTTSRGEGEPARYRRLAAALTAAGLAPEWTVDGQEASWRKAILNCGLNATCAVAGIRNGELVLDARYVELLNEVACKACEEAAAVAAATLRGASLDEQRRDDGAYKVALQALCRATAANRNSMLQDLDARRPTEVDDLCGTIAQLACASGLPCASNCALRDAVRLLEGGASRGEVAAALLSLADESAEPGPLRALSRAISLSSPRV